MKFLMILMLLFFTGSVLAAKNDAIIIKAASKEKVTTKKDLVVDTPEELKSLLHEFIKEGRPSRMVGTKGHTTALSMLEKKNSEARPSIGHPSNQTHFHS